MKSGMIALIAATAASSSAGSALAQCVSVDPVIAPQIRLDPLDAAGPGELVQSMMLTFRRTDMETAPLVVRYQIVDEDSSLRSRVGVSRGPALEWQGEDSSRDIGAFRSEAYSLLKSARVLIGENDQAARQTLRLRLTDLRADLPAGIYREQFTVRYWCGDDDSQAPYEAQGAIAVSVAVPNVLSASIAGSSARGEIDFMDFAAQARSLRVSVRSTGPYRVTARSLNGGVMLRENAAGVTDPADRIRYTATFGGEPLSLGDTSSGKLMERAGLLGQQIALEVVAEDVSAKRAGEYADTLLLTLSPAN